MGKHRTGCCGWLEIREPEIQLLRHRDREAASDTGSTEAVDRDQSLRASKIEMDTLIDEPFIMRSSALILLARP